MSAYQRFMTAMFIVFAIGVIAAHLHSRRRQRLILEEARRRRERKAEVEYAARKAL
jgi:heme exporter protein D